MRHGLACLAAVAACCAVSPSSSAQSCLVPPSPHPIRLAQPDGSPVELRLRGTGLHSWYEDLEGFPVVRRGQHWVYAVRGGFGRLDATGHVVGEVDPTLVGIAPNVVPLAPAVAAGQAPLVRFPGPNSTGNGGAAIGMTSTVKNLVLILRFSNHGPGGQNRTLPSSTDVGVIMNQVGGDPVLAPTGSVRDHYLEDSYGQLTIDSTIVGWLDVPNSETYYANGNSGLTSLTWNLIIDGLNLADPLVDFSQFDQDGDGAVDAITFLHSGYGAEWGGTDSYGTNYVDRMWSHKWSIPTWTSAEGVTVTDYNISPGLWALSGSNPGRIGVVCHELGHYFGLPDLYDTDGSAEGIGNWCLMAGGSWGFDGSQRYPSHMSAWCKSKIGWLVPQPILPGSFVAPEVENNATIFRIDNGYSPGEYLLIENRQATGFDAALPQGGLAVWHIDESKGSMGANDPNTDEGYPGQAGWPGNGSHYRVALLQADGGYDMERGLDRGDSGDVYHGAGTSQLDPTTTPDTDTYQGGGIQNTGNEITNIGFSSANVAFDYVNPGGPDLTTASLPQGNVGGAYNATLAATGGSTPYVWSEYVLAPTYTVSDLGSSLFANVGVAQGWRADEGIWALALPFSFPYYDTVYETVYVSSNGFLDFVPGEPEPFSASLALKVSLRIAAIWDDLRTDGTGNNIYVDSQSDHVTVRWKGRTYNGNLACNFSVTLHDDGRVQFDYGSGNTGLAPTVGISRGQGGDFELFSGYDQTSSLTNANSILCTPGGSQLPPGVALSTAGVLSGTTTTAGAYTPRIRVRDTSRLYDERDLTITVGAFSDCNNNGIDDATDISSGTSQDCNGNGIPDECELVGNDCNSNGVPDECDTDCNGNGTPDACETITDCNSNGIPDECELVGNDCNSNGVPDECDTDCNGNGTPDDCETITDCNSNGIPDECELVGNDCNSNGIPDDCETDCNGNGTPDECETFTDCNSNGTPDECELVGNDCNSNGIPDDCETDCNGNGIPDACETITDCNTNGIPDECELVGNDCNSNGIPDDCETDCNGNGIPDDCETITDCNSNGIPDECELVGNDCNSNGIPDDCETDCNGNGIPDSCETITDCNSNGIPDECELVGNDCNSNGIPDDCEPDCNGNGTPDACETITDCNGNGIPDECELVGNDCNSNGIPDDCETDCNGNGIPDDCETITDCNANGIPDECELAGNDCNSNGIPDDCETDCNGNGIPDDCETITDCNTNGIPDECELVGNDCNSNGIPDDCETDCNGNGIPDDCETITDCNSNGIPDECELVGNDCNLNGIPDDCETDCNGNGIPDDCETITDCNANGIPDECELAGNDCNSNGIPDDCETDCNGNGIPDDCETITDCNTNGIPDECELVGNDCNSNGIPDDCELADNDCNLNGILDECEPNMGIEFYCSGKTSSVGCIPFLTTVGTPSATDTAAFRVVANDVVPGQAGFLIYAYKKANLNFHGGKLCVKTPFQRSVAKLPKAGGTACSGEVLRFNFNTRIQSGIDPLLTPGQTVRTQWYQRDPGDPSGFADSLTNGVKFTICQ